MKTSFEIVATGRTFASGVLIDLIAALRATRNGDRIAIRGDEALGVELEKWSRLTGHAIVATEHGTPTRWIVRNGPARDDNDAPALGERLWLYTNFHCNLRCDYCCVRSTPTADPRELGLERIERIARESSSIGVREFFLTGGEPFLARDFGSIVHACAQVAPTTILTNGMLLSGSRLETLRSLPRRSVALQISIDSATSARHDLHRGAGTWQKAWTGVERARDEGFRVRIAATVSNDEEDAEFSRFLDEQQVAPEDRVIRRLALRGVADEGVALSRGDVTPEMTLTARGVYWHPVGADDDDFLVHPAIFPLDEALRALSAARDREREFGDRVASVFHCA